MYCVQRQNESKDLVDNAQRLTQRIFFSETLVAVCLLLEQQLLLLD